jgi:16S rRNA (uracil1498-N3)-methyltransferase
MARRRFFVEEIRHGQAEISGDEAKHLTRVLRVEVGQRYEISDNRGIYLAEIESACKEHVIFRVIDKVPPRPAPVRIALYASLIKFDHFEWLVEKATELGVESIIPVKAERSERGLEQAAEKRVERWRRIGSEASQQSRRDRLPEVELPIHFADAMRRPAGHCFVLDEGGAPKPLLSALPQDRSAGDLVALLVGPEGGWTDGERAQFEFAGWNPVSLGPQILRAETAAIAALSIVTAAYL